ncbi:MAG: MurR/RpiR family transcriptional regulator [Deltaproteobacteria bacterium]|nr:MurR/RpiR family transcriptional regulator [Deltaproteobacteria bacterium]
MHTESAVNYSLPLEKIIQDRFEQLTPNQAKLARYFLAQQQHIVFKPAAKIAREVGVSESTVVRFSIALGFEGFAHLQNRLKESLISRISPTQRLRAVEGWHDGYFAAFEADRENIDRTRDSNSPEWVDQAVRMILEARRVYILGYRPSKSAADFFATILGQAVPDVYAIDAGSGEHISMLMNFTPEDLVIAISFPRYSRKIYEVFKWAHSTGCKRIAITDSRVAPIGRIADVVLLANVRYPSYFNSNAGAFALINCIISSVVQRIRRQSLHRLTRLENMMKEMNELME